MQSQYWLKKSKGGGKRASYGVAGCIKQILPKALGNLSHHRAAKGSKIV
jgi:hypothetical protein